MKLVYFRPLPLRAPFFGTASHPSVSSVARGAALLAAEVVESMILSVVVVDADGDCSPTTMIGIPFFFFAATTLPPAVAAAFVSCFGAVDATVVVAVVVLVDGLGIDGDGVVAGVFSSV
jgi:hypothetical protein